MNDIEIQEKTKSKGPIVLILLLLVIVIGLGVFIFIKRDAIFSNNETKVECNNVNSNNDQKREEKVKEYNKIYGFDKNNIKNANGNTYKLITSDTIGYLNNIDTTGVIDIYDGTLGASEDSEFALLLYSDGSVKYVKRSNPKELKSISNLKNIVKFYEVSVTSGEFGSYTVLAQDIDGMLYDVIDYIN